MPSFPGQEMTNAKIIVKANGPYVVKGDIELFDTAGAGGLMLLGTARGCREVFNVKSID